MSTLSGPRRLLLCGAFALAVAAAPGYAALASPSSSAPAVASCAAGETEDLYTDNCIPELSPTVPGGNSPTPVDSGQLTESTPGDPESIPEVDGIPCNGGRSSAACYGLEQDAVPDVVPHSTLSSSP
ncbi:intersectin-EH binding protein Ibp1 [Mycolicibacterium komossense]|uniref:Intersectin-EH binding protein Ibp1 n=1 Tax=Mycolicibacterium komossense TaxID=1779 RepID=A0ABT3CMW0_9MYCO|nr:intersectin-EH binding protein Ibp1 [Mycolicibacterium komossense]MCV7230785.1 intersectin-EH binding protein Ibp1 [Mycolicibacterium komossense]